VACKYLGLRIWRCSCVQVIDPDVRPSSHVPSPGGWALHKFPLPIHVSKTNDERSYILKATLSDKLTLENLTVNSILTAIVWASITNRAGRVRAVVSAGARCGSEVRSHHQRFMRSAFTRLDGVETFLTREDDMERLSRDPVWNSWLVDYARLRAAHRMFHARRVRGALEISGTGLKLRVHKSSRIIQGTRNFKPTADTPRHRGSGEATLDVSASALGSVFKCSDEKTTSRFLNCFMCCSTPNPCSPLRPTHIYRNHPLNQTDPLGPPSSPTQPASASAPGMVAFEPFREHCGPYRSPHCRSSMRVTERAIVVRRCCDVA
jgi:hypothetical protein